MRKCLFGIVAMLLVAMVMFGAGLSIAEANEKAGVSITIEQEK